MTSVDEVGGTSSALTKMSPMSSKLNILSSRDVKKESGVPTTYSLSAHSIGSPPLVQSRDDCSSTQSADGTKLVAPFEVVSSMNHTVSNGVGPDGTISRSNQTTQTSSSKSKKCSSNITTSGRWTPGEHEAFLEGLKIYGREWKKVANCIPTRTSAQIRSHAQKYFAKISKEQQQRIDMSVKQNPSIAEDISVSHSQTEDKDHPLSKSLLETRESIMKDPSLLETRVCKTLASLRERYRQLEDKLQQVQIPASSIATLHSPASSPATLALEAEQKSLRKAAEARYEMKKFERKESNTSSTELPEPRITPCAFVSLASLPSRGDFSDVLALSIMGGNLGTSVGRIENTNRSIIKDENSLNLIRERLQRIENERPTKLRRVNDQL